VLEDLANHLGLLDEGDHAHNTLTFLPALDRQTTSAASRSEVMRSWENDARMMQRARFSMDFLCQRRMRGPT